MTDSIKRRYKATYERANLFNGNKKNNATEKIGNGRNDLSEIERREEQAFIEGYCYAIRVLEEGLVKEKR